MNGIFDVEVVGEALLQELPSLSALLAEGSCLPAVEGTGGLNLEDLRALLLVVACNNHTNTEGTHAT